MFTALLSSGSGRGSLRAFARGGRTNYTDLTPTTVFLVSDTHYGDDNLQLGNANARCVEALNSLPGTAHPMGGVVDKPAAVIHLGDCVHEDFEGPARFFRDYTPDGSGGVRFPCYVIDGNHDMNAVRTEIIARWGSLTWGFKIGRAYFQAMTETYTAPSNTTPPSVAQFAQVDGQLAARPASERKFLLFHRALSGTYPTEWDANALAALDAMVPARKIIGVFHGHDHETLHATRGTYRYFSPGSQTQAPVPQPGPPYTYTGIFPESFLVLRVREDNYDVANYIYGYDDSRVYAPGWDWYENVRL